MNVAIRKGVANRCDRCGLPGPTAELTIILPDGPNGDRDDWATVTLCNMCLAEAMQQATGDSCPNCQLTRKAIREGYRSRFSLHNWLDRHR